MLMPVQVRSPRRKAKRGKPRLSESVASHLRELIMSGELRAGEFIRIRAVAKAMDVSSTPVREGLLVLQGEAFVRLLPRLGFLVTGLSTRDLLAHFTEAALQRPDVLELAARVQPYVHADIDRDWSRSITPARVTVHFRDGTQADLQVRPPDGGGGASGAAR